jgi:hypothetical protein
MNTNVKKIILIFGGGLILFWAFKKIRPIGGLKKEKVKNVKISTAEQKKKAVVVITAYSDAMKDGQPDDFLKEMNMEFAKEFGLKVYTDKGSGKLFAADLEGNKIV